MADTKISALPAASAAAAANELGINEAGTSKKLTVAQLQDFLGVSKKVLAADQTSTSTTMAKVTGLDAVCGVGTWTFKYHCLWQTTATGTAVKFGVNHSGTVTRFVVEATGAEATTAASTGAMDQVHAAFGLRSGGSNRAISTTTSIFGPTAADTANADMLCVIQGVIVVSVSGNLELYFGSEATGSTQTIEAGSCLVLTKVG